MIKSILLAILISIGLFFSFYHLPEQYVFEYDRERDYNEVKSIVVDHKFTLIGPTVNAFIYLGPWYNYFQVPFFIFFGGDPIYGAYLIGTINFTVFLLIYLLIRRLTSSQLIAFFSAVLWVSSANRTNWSVSFLPLFFLIFVFLYEKFHRQKSLLTLSLMTFVWSLSLNFHPQMIFLAPVWFFAVVRLFLSHKTHRPKSALFLILALTAPIFPLIIFDLRHDFLDTRAVIRFLTANSGSAATVSSFRPLYSLTQFSLPLALPLEWFSHNVLFSLLLIVIGLFFVLKQPRYLYLLSVPLTSILLMSLYKAETWPEYYHYLGGLSLMLLLFIAAARTKIAKVIFLALSLFIIWSNFNYPMTYADPTSYYYKRQVILYMLSKNQPYEKMNIENDFRFGDGLGFGPIREFYEKPAGLYPPSLRFYVSYADSLKHNSSKVTFGAYGVSMIYEK